MGSHLSSRPSRRTVAVLATCLLVPIQHAMSEPASKASSYAPVVITEDFKDTVKRMGDAKPGIMKRQADLLADRYDLANRPAPGAAMSKGKPIQDGVRVKLPRGLSWEQLATIPKAGCCFPSSTSMKSSARQATAT